MNKRIYVTLSDESHEKITEMAEMEKRKVTPMTAVLVEEAIKAREQPEPILSYQQRIADELVKKKSDG